MTYQEELLEWVMKYAALGWHVIPLYSVNEDGTCTCGKIGCSDTGKHPITPRGLKDGSRDLAQLQTWFGSGAIVNVGIVTGEISGLTVLDVDVGPGKMGGETWAALIEEHGEPPTLMAQTGSGGMHVLFQYNSALKTSSNTLGKNVDCRNDRGYIVAAPSRHRSGGVYAWANWGTALAALPAHLSVRKESRGRPKNDDMYRDKVSLEQVIGMLAVIPADDRDLWRYVGIILGREFKRSEAAWDVYVTWAAKWEGQKGKGHDGIMHQAFYEISQQAAEKELSLGTLFKAALENGWVPKKGEVPKGQFVYYAPKNNFIYRPTGGDWIAHSVDIAVSPVNEEGKLIKGSIWIQSHQLVTSLTCDPELDEDYVKGFDCREGERIESPGAALFNTYRHPEIELGDAQLAGPFIEHCRKVFCEPGDADQFFDYMAHRTQKPWEKPRFALLIAGGQGIGKDTAVEFCCPAIGVWNVASIDPGVFETAYNEYAAATLVRINETANLQEMSKWAFNERTKVLIAGSPDMCRINPKYGHQYTKKMHCGTILTTNNLATGIFIPPDDRRYDVIACATLEKMGLSAEVPRREYFADLWDWFLHGGDHHVAAWLHERKLNGFSPNNGQRKTAAHREVVAINSATDHWLDDILDAFGYPDLVRADWIVHKAMEGGEKEGVVKGKLSPAMGRLGYVRYPNPEVKDGRWKKDGIKFVLYTKAGSVLPVDILDAVNKPPS